jgi:hypothetical protein
VIPSVVATVLNRLSERSEASAESTSDGYFVEPIEGSEGSRFFALSTHGEFAIVIKTQASKVPPAPVKLAAFNVDFGKECILIGNSSEEELRVTVVRCTTNERSLLDAFITMCGALADSLHIVSTEREVFDAVSHWSALFWRLQQRVDTDVVGLCGELVAIWSASNPDGWVQAWHARPNNLLDFEFQSSGCAVEVKATRSSKRQHTFGLEQVRGQPAERTFVASVPIFFVDSGMAVGDLVRDLLDRLLDDQSRHRLWDILSSTCGSGLEGVLSRTFDLGVAETGLRFYAASDIPTPVVELPLPRFVTQVKFAAILDDIPYVARAKMEALLAT